MHQVTRDNGVTIVQLGPSYAALDYDVLQDLGEVLLSQASYADPPVVVIDMTATSYVGSSFIELLVRAWKRLKHRDGMMALCGLQPFCQEVMRIARLDSIWPIYADRVEATSALTTS
jgi:anti-sigma B factor antagonist